VVSAATIAAKGGDPVGKKRYMSYSHHLRRQS
jgi:hypothetical protein